jgi:hypothetical protein
LPIGSARTVVSKQDILNNPIVKYQQDGENVCVFTSLSSVLFHLGLHEEASLIDDYRRNNFSTIMKDNSHRIMECVLEFIQKDHRFYNFKLNYMWKKLTSSHDLLKADVPIGDFRWVSLWSDDGSMNHAIAVTDNWIFDGNCSNALKLSTESLDECCVDSSFEAIRKGFHFTKKKNQFSFSQNALRRKSRKESKRKKDMQLK